MGTSVVVVVTVALVEAGVVAVLGVGMVVGMTSLALVLLAALT